MQRPCGTVTALMAGPRTTHLIGSTASRRTCRVVAAALSSEPLSLCHVPRPNTSQLISQLAALKGAGS